MTVSEFVDAATILGWRVNWKQKGINSFPFCRLCQIYRTCITCSADSPDGWCRSYYLYETVPDQEYTKRQLTEMRKANEKVFARLPDAAEYKGVVNVMRYCT